MLFTEFLDNIYLPVCLPKLDVDRFLTGLAARDLTHESLDKIRDVLSGVFSAAVRYGFLEPQPSPWAASAPREIAPRAPRVDHARSARRNRVADG